MKAVGALLLFTLTRAATATVRCAVNNVEICSFCIYRPIPQGIDTLTRDLDNCRNSPDCMLGSDDNCQPKPPPSPPPPTSSPSTTTPRPSLPTLKEISIKLNNRQGQGQGWNVKICSDKETCCQTKHILNFYRAITFSDDYDNFGDCGQFLKTDQFAFSVARTPIQTGQVDIKEVSVRFDDGSFFRKVKTWLRPIEWNTFYWSTHMTQTRTQTPMPPPTICPSANTTNTCQRDNVRIFKRLPHSRKRCYYQDCLRVERDLSTVPIGQAGLGTGGYCTQETQMRPQFKFCCNKKSYFHKEGEHDENGLPTPRHPDEIKFPMCSRMID